MKNMMKNVKLMCVALLMVSGLVSVQVTAEQQCRDEVGNVLDECRNPLTANQFETSITVEETDEGYRFTMSATNNSGTDITVDQMPLFANLFLWDGSQSMTHYLRGKNWDDNPEAFTAGQTVQESYEMTIEQLRSLDGQADGKYVFYAVPSVVVKGVYTQLMAVYYEFEVSTGEGSQPVEENPMESTVVAPTMDMNQFETSVEMVEMAKGYRFEMNVTNNSGVDTIVDQAPIFSSIMLWDETKKTWYKLRDPIRGQELKPQMVANGQTIVETFELSLETLQSVSGKVGGKYTFTAAPNLVVDEAAMQLATVSQTFTIDASDGDNSDYIDGLTRDDGLGIIDMGTDDAASDDRPQPENQADRAVSAPDEAAVDINFLSFPTEISTEKMDNGQHRFVMKVTNNSGRDIMVDNLPIFARIIVYDNQTSSWLYLREKSWEYKPAMFASGTTITEIYETKNLAAGKYYFFAVPSIVIANKYTQLMSVAAEFE